MIEEKGDVTPEMVEAGVSVLMASGRPNTDYERPSDALLVRDIYHAMKSRRELRIYPDCVVLRQPK